MTQPEPEPDAHALQRLATISFGDLLTMIDPMGSNKGDRQVIDLYRNWIALQGAGAARRTPRGSIWAPNGATPGSWRTPSSPIAPRWRCARISPPPRSTSACCWNGGAIRKWPLSHVGPRPCSPTRRASR